MARPMTGAFSIHPHIAILLDAFGGNEALADDVSARFAAYDAARAGLEELRRVQAAAMADADYVKQAVDELSALDAQEGEETSLAAERALLMNASRIVEEVAAAVGTAFRRARCGSVSGIRPQTFVADERRGAQGRIRRRSRSGTSVCADRRSAARARGFALAPGSGFRRAGAQGRAAVRHPRLGAQICHPARPFAGRAGRFPQPARSCSILAAEN